MLGAAVCHNAHQSTPIAWRKDSDQSLELYETDNHREIFQYTSWEQVRTGGGMKQKHSCSGCFQFFCYFPLPIVRLN